MEMDLMGESMGMYKGTEVRLQGGAKHGTRYLYL